MISTLTFLGVFLLSTAASAFISHFLEYFFFVRKEERPKLLSRETFVRMFNIWIFFMALFLLIFIFAVNFVHGWLIQPRLINTFVFAVTIPISIILIIVILLRWAKRHSIISQNTLPRLIESSMLRKWWMLFWPMLFVLTAASANASPNQIILLLPFQNGENVDTVFSQQAKNYLQNISRNDITVREFDCFITCPLPMTALSDPRIRLVITGNVVKQEGQSDQIEIAIHSRCRNDDERLGTVSQAEQVCVERFSFSLDPSYGVRFLDVYIPIFFMSTLTSTGTDNDLLPLINPAIRALSHTASLPDPNQRKAIHEKLFYDFLYNTPNLRLSERIASAGEVIASFRKVVSDKYATDYMLARWYEESGVLDSSGFINAIDKYKGLLSQNPKDSHLLFRLGSVSSRLERSIDAVCYFSLSNQQQSSDEKRRIIADLYEKIGYKPLDSDQPPIETLVQNPSELREVQDVQDPTSVEEYLSRGESALQDRRHEDALGWAQKAIVSPLASTVQIANAYFLIGRIKLNQSDTDGSVRAFDDLVKYVTENKLRTDTIIAAYEFSAVAYHSRGLHSKAAELYENALAFAIQPEQKARMIAKLADEEKLSGQYESAKASYSLSKKYFDSANILSAPLEQQRDYIDMTLESASLEEDNSLRNEQFEMVVDYYTKIINRKLDAANADYQGCEWLQTTGDFVAPSTFDYLKAYLKEPLLPPEYYTKRRNANAELHRIDDVRKDAEHEIARRAQTAITAVDFYNLGLAYMASQQYQNAIDAMQKAIDLDSPGDKNDIADATDYFVQGRAYNEMGKYNEAIAKLKLATNLQIQADARLAADYFNFIGDIYMKEKMYPDALIMYQSAKDRRSPDDKFLYAGDLMKIGQVYYRIGEENNSANDFKKSVSAYEEADQLVVDGISRAAIWFNIANDNFAIGIMSKNVTYYDLAIDAWQKAIDLDNPDKTAQGIDSRDVADYVQIARVYQVWSTIDTGKLQFARSFADQAISIPVASDDPDYIWHEAAVSLKAELGN